MEKCSEENKVRIFGNESIEDKTVTLYLLRFAYSWQDHCTGAWCYTVITAARNSCLPHERLTTTPGTTSPTRYEQCVGSLTSHRINLCTGCETGPTVYRPQLFKTLSVDLVEV